MGFIYRLQLAWYKLGLRRAIRRYGWTAVYVGDYHSAPTWVYTLGVDQTLNHPEIIVFDTTQTDANALLWMAFERVRSGDLVIEDGQDMPLSEGPNPVWRKVHPEQIDEWLPLACMRRFELTRRRSDLEAYQLVLRDGKDRLP